MPRVALLAVMLAQISLRFPEFEGQKKDFRRMASQLRGFEFLGRCVTNGAGRFMMVV